MIRPGRAADMNDIVRIRTSVRENHLSVEQMAAIGITPMSILSDIDAGNLCCFVAEDGNRVAGFAMADARDASLLALFVDPAHEGRGHGTALLQAAESWLRGRGHRRATLGTGRDTAAHAFYLRRGWRATGETSGHFAEDDVLGKTL